MDDARVEIVVRGRRTIWFFASRRALLAASNLPAIATADRRCLWGDVAPDRPFFLAVDRGKHAETGFAAPAWAPAWFHAAITTWQTTRADAWHRAVRARDQTGS